jgi:hypothetical protein
MVLNRPDLFDWFRRQEPVDQLGYSIHIYDVPEKADGDWVAHCLNPTPTLEDQNYVSKLVNQTDLRHVYFDCHTNWVFPNDGKPGWYILPQEEQWTVRRYFSDHLKLVYAESASSQASAFEIYYWNGATRLEEWMAAANKQARLAPSETFDLPLLVGETAQLDGYLVDGLQWLTIWRVQAATDIPLSIAGHLYTDDPSPSCPMAAG